jgi:N-acetylmuramoyl-L-alanine amidase
MKFLRDLLPYHSNLELRDPTGVDLIVIHCTELPTLAMAREFGERILYPDSQTGNSGHYYIDRDGKVVQYVEDDRIARHVIGHNATSIGIELVNSGRYPNWFHRDSQNPNDPYPHEQLMALRDLLHLLKQNHPGVSRMARHSDLDLQEIPAEDDPSVLIRRKIDPGPLFPWDDFLSYWKLLSGR